MLQTIGHADGIGGDPDAVQQRDELVPAQPRQLIDFSATPCHRFEASSSKSLGQLDQQLIARGMTEAVIDDLESIEIQKDHREELIGERLRAKDID